MAVFLLSLVSQYLLFILPWGLFILFINQLWIWNNALNTVSRGAWWPTVHGSQSQTQVKQVSTHASFYYDQSRLWEGITKSAPFTIFNGSLFFLLYFFQSHFEFGDFKVMLSSKLLSFNNYSKWLLAPIQAARLYFILQRWPVKSVHSAFPAVSFRCIQDTRGHLSWWLNQQGSSLPQSATKLIRHITNRISLSSEALKYTGI